jgi:hypothetical protein
VSHARWNLATTIAMAGWLVACAGGAVLVGFRTMFLGHLVTSGVAVYVFATRLGERARVTPHHSLPHWCWTGAYLALACLVVGALAMMVVNLGMGIFDWCCSDRFAGEFRLGSRTLGLTVWYAFAKPFAWIVLLGALPAIALGLLYGTLSWSRQRRYEHAHQERSA